MCHCRFQTLLCLPSYRKSLTYQQDSETPNRVERLLKKKKHRIVQYKLLPKTQQVVLWKDHKKTTLLNKRTTEN
jgi:hypothetical protein